MSVQLSEPWTVERFLAWEDQQDAKHEFDGTRIIAMTGGSRGHQRLVSRLLRLLEDSLDLERFDVVQEMRLQVGGRARYPDIAVVDGVVPDGLRTLRDAVVLFEILSDDTAATDRGAKREDYARLASIRRYVLLEQDRMAVTVLAMTPAGWTESKVVEGVLDLPEIGVALPLSQIYRGMRLR